MGTMPMLRWAIVAHSYIRDTRVTLCVGVPWCDYGVSVVWSYTDLNTFFPLRPVPTTLHNHAYPYPLWVYNPGDITIYARELSCFSAVASSRGDRALHS